MLILVSFLWVRRPYPFRCPARRFGTVASAPRRPEGREKAHAKRPAFARRDHARRLERERDAYRVAISRRGANARGARGGEWRGRTATVTSAPRGATGALLRWRTSPCSERGRRRREARRSCLRGRRRRDGYVERRLKRSRGAARGFRGRATRGGVTPGDTLAMRFFSRRLVLGAGCLVSRICEIARFFDEAGSGARGAPLDSRPPTGHPTDDTVRPTTRVVTRPSETAPALSCSPYLRRNALLVSPSPLPRGRAVPAAAASVRSTSSGASVARGPSGRRSASDSRRTSVGAIGVSVPAPALRGARRPVGADGDGGLGAIEGSTGELVARVAPLAASDAKTPTRDGFTHTPPPPPPPPPHPLSSFSPRRSVVVGSNPAGVEVLVARPPSLASASAATRLRLARASSDGVSPLALIASTFAPRLTSSSTEAASSAHAA